MGTGYYILLIISLIFIVHTSAIIGLYASDKITFHPDTSNWLWLSLGVAGMFGCFGMYLFIKSALTDNSTTKTKKFPPTSQTPLIVGRPVRTSPKPTQYGTVSQMEESHYGKPPKKTESEYGVIPWPSDSEKSRENLRAPSSEYDKVDSKVFKPSSEYGSVPDISSLGYGSIPRTGKKKIIYETLPPDFEEGANLSSLPNLQ